MGHHFRSEVGKKHPVRMGVNLLCRGGRPLFRLCVQDWGGGRSHRSSYDWFAIRRLYVVVVVDKL